VRNLSTIHIIRLVAVEAAEHVQPRVVDDRLVESASWRLKVIYGDASRPCLLLKDELVNIIESFLHLIYAPEYI